MTNDDRPFSERHGYVRKELQYERIDELLRNGLWNTFILHVWESGDYDDIVLHAIAQQDLSKDIWIGHFKQKVDDFPVRANVHNSSDEFVRKFVRAQFDGNAWYRVYDFLEFVVRHCPDGVSPTRFMEACNQTLKLERAAYRFVDGLVAPITNDLEIATVEHAIENSEEGVVTNLRCALEKLSDRQNPDYMNSIKESMSAVEGQAQKVMGSKTTLGRLLNRMQEERGLPVPLKTAFSAFYSYASAGESGIRHAPSGPVPPEIDFDFAKFMLVTCSAFVNYLAASMDSA